MANFFLRITDIISANISDMIDRVEDPERMIKHIIAEMEENIGRARDGVLNAITSEKELALELKHHQEQVSEWRNKAENAIKANKEDLARKALIRKKEHERITQDLEKAWESAKTHTESLKSQLRLLENKLEEAKRKRSTLVARQRVAEAKQYMGTTTTYFEKGIKAHDKFERMEDKVRSMEARAEAIKELDEDRSELEREFDALEVETDVENELEELRKKVDNK
ncbi:MAG: PspA/IM30 family protein [Desulfobacterales bacterium]|nr:PspA/IM30 family protein [Desulfobacterales bacterium]